MWKLNPQFFGDAPLSVAVVGVGGTGSEVVSNLIHLHLGLKALRLHGLHVVAFDPDRVAEANVVRQRYAPSDIGLFKADVLVHRVNLAYSLGWESVPKRFSATHARTNWDVVISCVDTRAARAELHKFAFKKRLGQWKFWLDCGNDATIGQVILGTPRSPGLQLRHHLPTATELHPEIMDVRRREAAAPSCSAFEALQRQDLMVNKMVATLAVDLLWRLFRDRQLAVHARYFDLANDSLAGRPVPALPRTGSSTGDAYEPHPRSAARDRVAHGDPAPRRRRQPARARRS